MVAIAGLSLIPILCKATFPAAFVTLMEECWRTGTVPAQALAGGPPPAVMIARMSRALTEPAERPTMEEVFDKLSDMYSIEVLTIPSM
jgi:hypothetical protein